MTTTEELQTLVLTTLDSKGSIENTKEFKASDGKEVDQLVLLGALKSLVDKEVIFFIFIIHSYIIISNLYL